VGADAFAKNFYLRTKGEIEDAVKKQNFRRVDILRPGLLRGARGGELRRAERLAMIAAPVADLLLHGQYRRFRSVQASDVARAILALAGAKADGRFVHDNDGIWRAPALARAKRGAIPVGPAVAD
ncbi:MAG TPA: hypothetical protein VHN58_01605, partial [Croceicoccus sp.]|nr:hypothetical protein [Croceicoccus sp.]